MQRHRLRAVLLVVVVVALGGMTWSIWVTTSARRARSLGELRLELLPNVTQRIQNFRRTKVRDDGRTEWEIAADEAQFLDDRDEIVVQRLVVTLHLNDGRLATLSGAEGVIHLDGREVETIRVRGDVGLVVDDMELRTAEAVYDRARDMVTAPGTVTVHGAKMDVRADGLEMDVEPQMVRLRGSVETVLRGEVDAS